MGLSYQVLPHTQEDFSGGQNSRDNPSELAPDEAALIQNWYVDKKGQLDKRDGITLKGKDQGATKVLGLANFYRGESDHDLMMMSGTTLNYFNTTDWASLDTGFTTGLQTEFEVANDILYMTNGTDNVHSWDRASTTLNSCLTDEGAGATDPPKAIDLKWHRNYMFYAGDGTSPEKLFVSDLNDPQTVTVATNYFTFSEPIFAIGELKDFLVIFGQRRIWTLQIVGTTLADWVIEPVNESVGCIARRSIQQVDNDLFFLSNDGVRSLLLTAEDNVRMGRLSDKVDDVIARINRTTVNLSCSCFYKKRYYLFVPVDSSAYPNMGLVRESNVETGKSAWTTITGWSPSDMVVQKDQSTETMFIGEGQADTLVYTGDSGSDDNGTDIDADLQTAAFTFGFNTRYKRGYQVDARAYDSGTYTLICYHNLDGAGWSSLGTMDLQPDTGTFPFTFPKTFGTVEESFDSFTAIDNYFRKIQLRFRSNNGSSATEFNSLTIHYKLRKFGY